MPSGNLLIVGNFPSNTGYAWNTIGEYFLALSELFLDNGRRAIICYPTVDGIPEKFRSGGMEITEFDFTRAGAGELFRFIRSCGIGTVYLTDRSVYSPKYAVCRAAGVKRILVHDRTSGHRNKPGLVKKAAKSFINMRPLFSADFAIGISEYVKRRLIDVACFPEERVVRIWNGIDIRKFCPGEDDLAYRAFGIHSDRKIIVAYSRANRYKGIQVLIEAADIIVNRQGREDFQFLFLGDGPDLGTFRDMVRDKGLHRCFQCPGEAKDIHRVLKGVMAVVVPSLWQEGFGLSVIEGMATGKPVIASGVGGIVDIIEHSKNGFLFTPGDSGRLADHIIELADDAALRDRIGRAARDTVIDKFDIEDKKRELAGFFKKVCIE